MKITCIIPSFYPAVVYGGWIFSSLNAYRELGKLGATTFVATTNDNGKKSLVSNTSSFLKLEDHIFVKYYPQSVQEKFSLSILLNMWKDIKKGDIVRIHGIFSATTPIGLIYSYFLHKKVVLTPHGCLGTWCLADGNRFKKSYLNLLIRPFTRKVTWHATSCQEAEEIKVLFPKSNIEIIPNGISLQEFETINHFSKSEFLKKYIQLGRSPNKVIISMGRLHRKKGFDILINAFKIYLQKFPDSVLLIAGDDFGYKKNLERLVKENFLEDNVFFVGHISGQERIDFLANGDIFALSSHNENFGLVYAEAMAAGTPVVASTGTPWREVEELKIGKWVENDPEAFSDALVNLSLQDCNALGKNSQTFISNNYSWESVAAKFDLLLKKIVDNT